VPRRS